MKNPLITFFVNYLLSTSLMAQSTYLVNIEKSKFNWNGFASVGGYAPTGTLKCKSGTLNFDGKNISKAFFLFDMKTISHENANMQNHLKGTDFFDVEKYPIASFKLEKIVGNKASGILKIKSIQKRISFPISVKNKGKMILVEAKVNINRTDFGIKYNSTSFFKDLGDYAIKDNFEFEFEILAEK